jgi:hypothetical protein
MTDRPNPPERTDASDGKKLPQTSDANERQNLPETSRANESHALSAPTKPPGVTILQWAILGVILLVAAAARFVQVAQFSMWIDEIWSVELATGRGPALNYIPADVIVADPPDLTALADAPPAWRVWSGMRDDPVQPPLYYLLLRLWLDLFGNSPAAARGFSVVASLLAILVLFDACRLIAGTGPALATAALCALAVPQIAMAQEARGYALLTLAGMGCCDCVIRIRRDELNRWRGLFLGLFVLIAMLTHYYAAGAILGLAGFIALRLPRREATKLAAIFVCAAVAFAIVWGPWALAPLGHMPHGTPTWLGEPRDGHLWRDALRVIGLPTRFLFDPAEHVPWQLSLTLAAIALLAPIAYLIAGRRDDLLIGWCWLWGAIGLIAAMDAIRSLTQLVFIRYTILASPALYALLATMLWNPVPGNRESESHGSRNLDSRNLDSRNLDLANLDPGNRGSPEPEAAVSNAFGTTSPGVWARRCGRIALAALLAGLAFQTAMRLRTGVVAHEDWRRLDTIIDKNAGPSDLLVFYGTTLGDEWGLPPWVWYMGFRYYTPDSNRPVILLDKPASLETLAKFAEFKRVWLIGISPAADAAKYLPGCKAGRASAMTSAGGVCSVVRDRRRARTLS